MAVKGYYVETPSGSYFVPETGGLTAPPPTPEEVVQKAIGVTTPEKWQPLTTEQIKDVQAQQRAKQLTIIPKETAVTGLTGKALSSFMEKATPAEKAELMRGTRLKITQAPQIERPPVDVAPPVFKEEPLEVLPGIITLKPQVLPGARKIAEVGYEFKKGYTYELKERPYRTLALTAISFVAPPVFAGVGKVSTYVMGARATAITGKVLGYGVAGAYAGYTGYRIYKEPSWQLKVQKFGRITAGEITPMFVGGALGAEVFPKVSGWWRTRGRVEIPTEKIVMKQARLGIKKYPTAPTKQHLKMFTEYKYKIPGVEKPVMYHATAPQYWKTGKGFETIPGKRELPGLFTAPGISPQFLRVGGARYTFYGGTLFEPYGKPAVAGIIPKGFKVGAYTWKQYYAGIPYKKGIAYIPGTIMGKTEIQALLPPGQKLLPKVLPKKYFFRWGGVRVPIDIFQTQIGTQVSKVTKGAELTLGKVMASYRMPTPTPIITPPSIVAPLVSRARPSYYRPPSRVSFIPPTYRPPSRVPYRPPSYPSYVPPSRVPVRPPSYPPYRPPSRPPSYPPSRPPSYPPYRPPSRPPSYPPYRPPSLPPPAFFLPAGVKKYPIRKILPKADYGYVPSYMALAFKRFGKPIYKKRYTGLEFRPIPTKFRFGKTKLIPIVRRKKSRRKK